MEALEKAGPGDFPRLARLAQSNPTALRFVAARWVEVAPRNLFDTILAERESGQRPMEELRRTLFNEWPKRDPDAVIAAVNENKHSIPRYWKFDAAYALIQKDFERGIRLMSEWEVTDTGFGTSGIAAVTKWTQANPRHAAEFMLDQPNSGTIRSTMEAIGREWARIDPANAMAFVASRRGESAGMLAGAALKEWAQGDLAQATDWLSGKRIGVVPGESYRECFRRSSRWSSKRDKGYVRGSDAGEWDGSFAGPNGSSACRGRKMVSDPGIGPDNHSRSG
jgi:hypothetical protein